MTGSGATVVRRCPFFLPLRSYSFLGGLWAGAHLGEFLFSTARHVSDGFACLGDTVKAALNEEFLKGNSCFGCGPDNPDGLRIRIFRDGQSASRLVGTYRPRETQIGFPQIVHGGLQFTALDCMAAWTVLILRQPGNLMPITKSATTRFLKPACFGIELSLSSEVIREATQSREPLLIRGAIRDPAGEILTEIDFEYLLLPQQRFLQAIGLEAMPDSYRRHFGEL